jgi:hypothetical protein
MTRLGLIFLFLFISIIGFSTDTDTGGYKLNTDSNKTKSTKPKKTNSNLKSDISGTINYNFNLFQTNSNSIDTIIPYQLNMPRHFVSGMINTSVKDIPISAKFVYDPYLKKKDQFKINFSFDREKFNSDLEKKYKNQKKDYSSFQDSLVQTNLETSLKKQLAQLKIDQLKKSSPSIDTNYSLPNDRINQDSINQLTIQPIPDSTFKQHDSLTSYNPSQIDSIQKKQDSITQAISALEKKIEKYDQQIDQINNHFENDSILKQNSKKFNLRKSISSDSLGYQQYITNTEKILNSVRTFQIGTISPYFSKLSTYRATITGLDIEFKTSKTTSIHTFAGWQPNFNYTQTKNAIKSVGFKFTSDILSSVELSTSIIHSYRKHQVFGETKLPEINNSILSLSLKSISLKNIELGTEIDYSTNLKNIETINEISTHIGFSNYIKVQLPSTKSRFFVEMSYIPKNFKNYLTPYQIPSNTEYKGSFSQQLFKSKLTSLLTSTYRNIHPKENLFTKNSFTQFTWDLRTRWSRYPNVFANISTNSNEFITKNNLKRSTKTNLYITGISFLHKIKLTKLYGEFSYQYRTSTNNLTTYNSNRYRFQFRLKNKLLNYNLNSLYSTSIYNTIEISNQIIFNVSKSLKLGSINRWNQINGLNKFSNGIKSSWTYKKITCRAEYIYVLYDTQSVNNHIVNALVSLKF